MELLCLIHPEFPLDFFFFLIPRPIFHTVISFSENQKISGCFSRQISLKVHFQVQILELVKLHGHLTNYIYIS